MLHGTHRSFPSRRRACFIKNILQIMLQSELHKENQTNRIEQSKLYKVNYKVNCTKHV